ncbi:uncharacterized protein LOC143200299 isoform X2 [Rhynchophorus ferrugineus]|uniref:uncharacterized protein LOC143200299 isoform X2 n=1 Tax=Rhynchophorus ferrugineus TaxID=354439 RepID=UPI003FCC2B9E
MEKNVFFLLTLFLLIKTNHAETIEVSSTPQSDIPIQKPEVENPSTSNTVENALQTTMIGQTNQVPVQGYMPQPVYPIYPGGYFYPGVNPNAMAEANNQVQSTTYLSSVMPIAQAALQAALKLFAKVGLFAIGGAALLMIGGIFTTIICNLTPICTITFYGYDFKSLNKESVRSLMTPEKIASAAALVQDAIGKYQRLQRAVGQ